MLTINNSTRALIITQDFLKGFLDKNHDNGHSWFYEFDLSVNFRKQMSICISEQRLNFLKFKLGAQDTFEQKEEVLRLTEPTIYAEYLSTTGQ